MPPTAEGWVPEHFYAEVLAVLRRQFLIERVLTETQATAAVGRHLPARVSATTSGGPYARRMWIRRAIAVVLLVVGGAWFFQGIGVIEGSFMTGEALWAMIGVVCVLAGIALMVIRPTRV
ncbi:MAG TPA: hypothetical protein VGA62_02920 [Acidimicrobiia bacterium]